ncbi:MAG TPA: hypothetical protein VHM00_00330 [Caldimonas sp.]|nr:hypothetical protein [Caldimonas sp.]HEX2539510.1 hypothetical protein [Caldimonas sp.]
MTKPTERRSEESELGDAFSPEYLAMLVICGGTVRDSDWDLLPETVAARRPRPRDERATETLPGDEEAPRE